MENTNEEDTDAAIAFADTISKYLSTRAEDMPYKDGKYSTREIEPGYYLVMNEGNVPTVEGQTATKTRYILRVVEDVTAQPKRGTLVDDKYIRMNIPVPGAPEGTEGVDYFKVNNAPIEGTVDYVIPVRLPENYEDYKMYHLAFIDTLSKGLTLDVNSIKLVAVNPAETKMEGDVYRNPEVKNDVSAVMDAITEKDTNGNIIFKDDKVNNIEVGEGKTFAFSQTTTDGGNEISIWNGDLKNATTGVADLQNNQWIVLTYSATVNTNAVIGITGNPNFVKVVYSNDPNHTGSGSSTPTPGPENPTGVTPDKKVKTCVTEFAILKTNESGEILAGAEFSLTTKNGKKITLVEEDTFEANDNGEYWKLRDMVDGKETNVRYTLTAPTTENIDTSKYELKAGSDNEYQKYKYDPSKRTFKEESTGQTSVRATVGSDGRIVFTGLGAGEYTLKEEVTPDGYNTFGPLDFEIEFTNSDNYDDENARFSIKEGTGVIDGKQVVTLGSNNTLQADIVNRRGSLLPSTGGIGTTIFYIIGGVLIVGAGILLVAKKRMSAK